MKSPSFRSSFLTSCLALLAFCLPALAQAATLNVPTALYPTIQSAINAAVSGDTVLVAAGTYSGPGNRDIDFIGKSLTVMSQAGAGSTIIDCGGYASTDGSGNHRGFYIHSGELKATISGFTVKNGYETYVTTIPNSNTGGSICIINTGNGTITLTNCTVSGNSATEGGGIYNYNNYNSSGTTTLTNCTVSGNSATEGGGIYNINIGTITLTNCTVSGNSANYGGGIYNGSYSSGTTTLTNCTVSGNSANYGGGIYNYSGSTITLSNDIIYGDFGGEIVNDPDSTYNAIVIYSDVQGGSSGIGNINVDPLFVNAAYGDLHLKPGSPCIKAGTAAGAPTSDKDGNLRGNPPSMGAYEGVGAGVIVQRPAGSLTLYDAGYDASHVDFSDNAVGPIDVARLTSDTQVCTGAVADGATKVLLRYTASAPGTVTFTETGGISGDSLRAINTTTQVFNGQNIAFALYTVPESLTPAQTTNLVAFQAVWTPAAGAAVTASATLTLERTPIILIHGLWSSPSDTWNKTGGVRDMLVDAGYVADPNSPNRSLFLVDYSGTNTAALEVNQGVLLLNPGGIKTVHQAYQARGVAMTRVDVVGHSMGGLITRKFADWSIYSTKHNFGKGYVRRMITIATPHLGSPLGTYLSALHSLPGLGATIDVLLFKMGKGYGPAIQELEPGSSDLLSLGKTNIPCYAEVGNYDVEHLGDLTNLYNLLLFFGYNLHLGGNPSLSQLDAALFLGQQNDAVVPVPSQEGGLPSLFYNVTGFTNHLQETGSSTIGADVARLLTGPLSNFETAGFSAASKTVAQTSRHSSPQDAAVTAPFIAIATPTEGQVFHTGDTLTVTVVPNAGTALAQALIQAGASPRDAGTALISLAPFTAIFTLPASSLGTVPITVTGKDNAGNVCTVTVNILVQTNASLASMTVAAEAAAPSGAALLTSQGSTDVLTVTGTFSDASQSDITASALGTTYTSSDPTIASIDANGILTAVANGTCTITVVNGSITATENVIVQLGTPVVLSTTPSSAAPGATVTLALTGTDFGAASQVQFLINGVPDPNITVTHIQANTPESSLTATVSLKGSASVGLHTVVVTTPGGASDPLAASDAAGFVVTASANSHILWNKTDGTASIWNYNTVSGTFTHNSYGPYPGWSAKTLADGGTDNQTRVLWNKSDGMASIWSLNNTTGVFTLHSFGPYPGWSAKTLSVGIDNTTHVLWTNADGRASLWNYNTSTGGFTYNIYGPYPKWSAKAVSDGPDARTRLLWTNTSNAMSLWSLDNVAGAFSQFSFGPYAGWSANGVSVGSGGATHVLWNNTSKALSLWNDSTVTGIFSQFTYGPYPGWTAVGTADGTDGKTRVLWDKTDGTMSLWSLDNTAGIYRQFSFGPYSGWTAIAVSAQ